MKSTLAALAALLLASTTSFAINLTFLPWDEKVAERELSLVAGTRQNPIADLHPLKRTPEMQVQPNEAGEIAVRALDRKTDDGKPVELMVKLAPGLQRPLVLLLPDPQAPSGLRGFAFEDTIDAFPWGSFRILNVTGADLIMGVGPKRHPLPSGWKPLDIPVEGEKPLPIYFVLSAAPEAPLFTASWQADPDSRRLVILVPGTDPRLGKLAVKVVPENRHAAAAAE